METTTIFAEGIKGKSEETTNYKMRECMVVLKTARLQIEWEINAFLNMIFLSFIFDDVCYLMVRRKPHSGLQ